MSVCGGEGNETIQNWTARARWSRLAEIGSESEQVTVAGDVDIGPADASQAVVKFDDWRHTTTVPQASPPGYAAPPGTDESWRDSLAWAHRIEAVDRRKNSRQCRDDVVAIPDDRSPVGRPTRPTAARPRSSPPPVPVASAAPRDGPRPSCHVFADGARVAAGRHRLLGNLPGVPHVGHPRALLLQRAVGGLPARVPRLRVERAGLAPRRARQVARVGGRRRIEEVANGGGVQDVGAAIEVDQVRTA